MIGRPFTEQDRRQLQLWHRLRVPLAEQARRLGRTYSSIAHARKDLLKAGKIRRLHHGGGRAWTKREHGLLESLVEQGISYAEIGRRLRRSEGAILARMKLRRISRKSTGNVMTALQVARLLGFSCNQPVVGWIGRGWLQAVNAGSETLPRWSITDDALHAFLESPDYAMAWHPSRITDPDLRAWATEVYDRHPRWLRSRDVADRFHVGLLRVSEWYRRGLLPGTVYCNLWFKESDLDAFVPPYERRAA